MGRDFTPDGVIEAAEIHGGDPCPRCGHELEIARGIEIGHIFQLGRRYAKALGLTVLDQNGKTQVVTMGSYGIGVSRAVAAIAETVADDKGLCWPREISPADVHIVITGKPTDPTVPAAETLAAELQAAGLRVLLDDRVGTSPGIKFNDAELLGVPTIVVVGKGLANGTIEVKDRKSGERVDVAVGDAVAHLLDVCR
jgi:prolyl-tRNA synthetase